MNTSVMKIIIDNFYKNVYSGAYQYAGCAICLLLLNTGSTDYY